MQISNANNGYRYDHLFLLPEWKVFLFPKCHFDTKWHFHFYIKCQSYQYFSICLQKSLIKFLCILFQFNCCGVHSSEDFSQATEFLKYARDEGEGQIIPEACCMLDDFPKNGQLFTPKDVNCISTPTTSNSYMSRVRVQYYTFLTTRCLEVIWYHLC